jgi:predicted dinucleotide-binding enzyme
MKIAFIGYGNVGAPLADQLQRLGHTVTLAAQDPASDNVRKALARNAGLLVASPAQAVTSADVVFLATPFLANEDALGAVSEALSGKILIDCTNPVGPGLTHGLKSVESGSQRVQHLAPGARVVKAFSIYGFENLEASGRPTSPVKPVMMLCGNDPAAKVTTTDLVAQLGWDPLDVGGLDQALALEHLTLLWIRMVRVNGASPHLMWAKVGGGSQ